MITKIWRQLKVWRRLHIGPVTMLFGFRRRTPVTPGTWKLSRQRELSGTRAAQPHSAKTPPQDKRGTAVIVGVGTGFGYSLAKKLASDGFDIALLSRNADRLSLLCEELRQRGVKAHSYGLDATHETDVKDIFKKVVERHGTPSMVVYSLQEFTPGDVLDVSVPAFESSWRHNCLGAFLVSQEAARAMSPSGRGSIFLIGSTSSIIGRAGHLSLAVGKFGQRALAQVLCRELWPVGLHVAHVLIDADIRRPNVMSTEAVQSDPDDIAISILALHNQPRSAWSSEIDLRPSNEQFWEHC